MLEMNINEMEEIEHLERISNSAQGVCSFGMFQELGIFLIVQTSPEEAELTTLEWMDGWMNEL